MILNDLTTFSDEEEERVRQTSQIEENWILEWKNKVIMPISQSKDYYTTEIFSHLENLQNIYNCWVTE